MMGGLAQLGEHLLCKQGVVGSIPSSSTNSFSIDTIVFEFCITLIVWHNLKTIVFNAVVKFFNKMEEVKKTHLFVMKRYV